MVRDHAQRLRPAGERRLEQLLRQRAQTGAQREKHERRVLDAQHQDDPSGRVQRIAAAQRRRDAQQLEQRARRSEHLQPRKRHDLRRQHQRHHEAEDERVAAADVGERHDQRNEPPITTASAVPPNAVTQAVPVAVQVARSTARGVSAVAGHCAARHDAFQQKPRERQHRQDERRPRPSPTAARSPRTRPRTPEAFAMQ